MVYHISMNQMGDTSYCLLELYYQPVIVTVVRILSPLEKLKFIQDGLQDLLVALSMIGLKLSPSHECNY